MMQKMMPVLALLAATPIAAQEWQVAREQFVHAGTRLTIQVETDAPGTLRLIRGQPGSVRVASRAQEGFTTSGLAEDDRLTLSSVGAGPVDFLVAVPENVWVNVRLPTKALGDNVARGRTGTWEWHAGQRPDRAPVTQWMPDTDYPNEPWDEPFYTTFSRDLAPADIDVPDLSVISRISVRIQGLRFKVIADRPLSVDEGNPRTLVIRPAGPPMSLVLSVPTGTRKLTLRLGGQTALILDGDQVTTLCVPVTEQRLSDDRQWFTFNPMESTLDCRGDAIQRHGG